MQLPTCLFNFNYFVSRVLAQLETCSNDLAEEDLSTDHVEYPSGYHQVSLRIPSGTNTQMYFAMHGLELTYLLTLL